MEKDSILADQLSDLELDIYDILKEINSPKKNWNETKIDSLSVHVSNYSQFINRYLKEYGEISYESAKAEKIQVKALINFSYHCLNVLMKIVRILENEFIDIQSFDLYCTQYFEIVDKKDQLLTNSYLPAAEEELNAFYNPLIRNILEKDLEKRIGSRKFLSE